MKIVKIRNFSESEFHSLAETLSPSIETEKFILQGNITTKFLFRLPIVHEGEFLGEEVHIWVPIQKYQRMYMIRGALNAEKQTDYLPIFEQMLFTFKFH